MCALPLESGPTRGKPRLGPSETKATLMALPMARLPREAGDPLVPPLLTRDAVWPEVAASAMCPSSRPPV